MKSLMKSIISKKSLLIGLSVFATLSASAATFSLSGNHRFGTNLFSNMDLATGTLPGVGDTLTFLEHRLLLRPDVVVDDRFTIKSEMSLLQIGPASANAVGDGFGSALDSTSVQSNAQAMVLLRRAWLEWASDWGIFRAGRMPKSWGLGLLYNAGSDVFDDFGTTVDRVTFQAMLGNLGLNIGYEKEAEGLLANDGDDAEAYELSLDYSNPESLFDVGLLYARRVRMAGSAPYSAGLRSSNDLSIFAKKRAGRFQFGGEFVSIAQDTKSNAIGALAQIDYMPGHWNLGLDVGFASGAADTPFTFHPNYRPFLILYRQTVGPTSNPAAVRGGASGSSVGSALGAGTGNGSFLTKASLSYAFAASRLTFGTDIGFASLARAGSSGGSFLGVETDLHLTQQWYENFQTVYAAGFLVPGSGFGPNAKAGWGVQVRGALTF